MTDQKSSTVARLLADLPSMAGAVPSDVDVVIPVGPHDQMSVVLDQLRTHAAHSAAVYMALPSGWLPFVMTVVDRQPLIEPSAQSPDQTVAEFLSLYMGGNRAPVFFTGQPVTAGCGHEAHTYSGELILT